MILSRDVTILLASLCLTACLGCGQEEPIRHYKVPKQSQIDEIAQADWPPRRPAVKAPPTLIVGAIVPRQTTCWFFKLTLSSGLDSDSIGSSFGQVNTFFRTLNVPEDEAKPLTWTLPSGWSQSAGDARRYATIHTGPEADAPQLTVSMLSITTDLDSYIQMNIDRWRRQMKAGPDELLERIDTIQVKGAEATIAMMLRNTAPQGPPPDAEPNVNLTYDVPEGWNPGTTATDRRSGFMVKREAAFTVEDGERQVETTIIGMKNSPFIGHVNFWRGQAGLKPVEQLDETAKKIEVAGISGDYIEVIGPKKTILGVMVVREQKAWFITLKGDDALAQREKQHFEQFVKSIQFNKPEGPGDGN